MAGLNEWRGIGNLAADAQSRQAGSSTVCNFRIACTETWTDRDGNKQERVEWVPVVTWGRLAEDCSGLAKGARVYVEGPLQTREWTDKEGIKRFTTEIKAAEVLVPVSSRAETQPERGREVTPRADRKPPDVQPPRSGRRADPPWMTPAAGEGDEL